MKSRILKVTLSSFLTLAVAGSAYGQEEPVEGEEGMEGGGEATEGGEGAPAEGGEGAPAEGGDAAATGTGQMVGPFTKESYPMEVIYRPLTLTKGMIEARGALSVASLTLCFQIDPMMPPACASDTFIGLGVGAGYGITDKLEAGISTGFRIDPDAGWGENLGLYAAFSVIDQDKLDLAVSAGTELSFVEGGDTFSGVSISANTRFLINDKIFIRGGAGLIDLTINPESGARLNLMAGGGFQVNPNLAVMLDLGLASIKLFGDFEPDSTFFDPLGVNLTGLYAINNKLDAFVMVMLPSVADAGDFWILNAGANFRL